jgi:hypothetical protein
LYFDKDIRDKRERRIKKFNEAQRHDHHEDHVRTLPTPLWKAVYNH